MIVNIQDILQDSLILVGAMAQGQTPNSDDLNLALRVVNRKLDSLSAEKLSMIGLLRSQYPLTGAASYPFGIGFTWSFTARPVKIKAASTLSTLGTEHMARIDTADQWAAVDDKTRTGVYIEDLFWDGGYPSGNIWVSPKPAAGNCILWTYQQIPSFASTTGTVDLAPGYSETLVAIAAFDLCIAFQRPVTQELMAAQTQAKQVIVQLNAELYNAPAPPPLGPGPTSPPAIQTT